MKTLEEIRVMLEDGFRVSSMVCEKCEEGCGMRLATCKAWHPVGTILVWDERAEE